MTFLFYLYLSFSDVVGKVEDKYIYGWLFICSMLVLLVVNTFIYICFMFRITRLYYYRYYNRYVDWKENLIEKYPVLKKFTHLNFGKKVDMEPILVSRSILKKKEIKPNNENE